MEKFDELKFIDHIGEINRSTIHNLNIESAKCGEREYEFYISILKTCQIFTCRFSLCQNLIQDKESISSYGSKEQLSILIKYWKTFYLPFSQVDFAVTKEGIWILGDTCYSNIKPFLLEHLNFDSVEDSLMDVDEDEFNLQAFGSKINLPSTLVHKIASEKFYLKCNAFDHKIVMGSNDGKKLQLNVVSSKYEPVMNAELSDITQLLEIPIKPCRRDSTCKDESPSLIKPVLKLCPVQHTESKSNVLCKLLGSAFPSKNCVGFVSQPNNKIYYSLCSWPGEISTLVISMKLKEIYDMKQPVLGIHVVQNMGGIKGTNVLVVGSLGKIVCLSGRRVAVNERNEEILKNENVSLYATTFELSSPVQQHVIFKDNVVFLSSEGKIYCSKFSSKECKGTIILVLSQRCTLLQQVMKFILLDENAGLFLILTNSGLLHLYEFTESKESEIALSLPALMNQAMLISSHLQTLNTTKSIQAKFFEAVSTFASMKFRGIKDMKIYFTYSIKNVKNPPRKFIFVDVKGLERYKLEREFWVLSATASSRFEKKCPVLSKTVPLDSGNPNICLEIDESIFRSWDSSAHPFILELGFILTLPEKLKQLDCFKLIKGEVPLYCKAKEFIMDELSFMETEPIRTVKRLKTSHFRFGDQLMKDVIDLSKKRTIYQLLRPECQTSLHSTDFVDSFKLCILQSTAEKVLHLDTSYADLPAQWLQGVMRKAIQDKTSVFDVKFRDKTASITISIINNHLIFNIHSEEFNFLAGLKIAITNLLVALQDLTGKMDASVFEVSVELRNDCEKLSKELRELGEQGVEREDFHELLKLKYKNLRIISSKLIYC